MPDQVHLLVIDPQNDFVHPDGRLCVPGARADMDRLAVMVRRMKHKLADIHVTLDSHRKVDISHPIWWRDASGNHPAPFTAISALDVDSGKWTTSMPSAWDRSRAYVKALDATGRYPHVIWPEHCLIGDEGHNVWPALAEAIHDWEDRFALADYVTKGSNPWTEHFSAVQAEVPDAEDPGTQLNIRLVQTLERADTVILAGEALSHCLANTVRDVCNAFGDDTAVKKLVLLTDATSSVPGFEKLGAKFVADLVQKGMRTALTTDVH